MASRIDSDDDDPQPGPSTSTPKRRIWRRMVSSSDEDNDCDKDKPKDADDSSPVITLNEEESTPESSNVEPEPEKNPTQDRPTRTRESPKKRQCKENLEKLLAQKRRRSAHQRNNIIDDADDEPVVVETQIEENIDKSMFDKKTKVFPAKFNSVCEMPGCRKQIIKMKTKIFGTWLLNKETGQYYGHPSISRKGQLFYICADHHDTYQDYGVNDSGYFEADCTDDEEEDEDMKDFIDDSGVGEDELLKKELKKVNKKLSRNTTKDRENTERFMEEQKKYQLQVHCQTNPSLFLSEEKRFKRNMKTASFDQGLKQDIGLNHNDLEYHERIRIDVRGEVAEVFKRGVRTSKFPTSCALEYCSVKFKPQYTLIVKAFLKDNKGKLGPDSNGKPHWICYTHYQHHLDQYQSDDTTDDTTDETTTSDTETDSEDEFQPQPSTSRASVPQVKPKAKKKKRPESSSSLSPCEGDDGKYDMSVANVEKIKLENKWNWKENEFLLESQKKLTGAISLTSINASLDVFSMSDHQNQAESFYDERRQAFESIITSQELSDEMEATIVQLVQESSDLEERNNVLRNNITSLENHLRALERKDEEHTID